MKKYIFIGIGGFLGAVSRGFIKNIHMYNNVKIPLDTLFINVTGSFMLALVLTIAIKSLKIDEDVQLGISTGFMGAYTTFSTLCKETVNLIINTHYYMALFYIIISVSLGLIAAYLGVIAANKINSKIVKNEDESDYDEDDQDIDEVV